MRICVFARKDSYLRKCAFSYFRLRVMLTLPRDENTKNSFAHELPASDVVVLVERDTKHCGTLRISTVGIKSHFCNS